MDRTYVIDKKRILLIFPPDRVELYDYFVRENRCEYYILFNEFNNGKQSRIPEFIKKQYFWQDFATPQKILSTIKPEVVVFIEIFDYRQIALATAANHFKIKTVFLDHGAVTNLNNYKQRNKIDKKQNSIRRIKALSKLYSVLRVRFFYFSVWRYISIKNWIRFLKLPLFIQILNNSNALHRVHFKEKSMSKYILFNKNNYELYNYLYHLNGQNIVYTGIPSFDFLINSKKDGENVIYIDHPYLEKGLFGWTKEHHRKIAIKLKEFANIYKLSVYIKLHPQSDISIWRSYGIDGDNLRIIQFGDFKNIYDEANLILSYSSSMIPGFLSAKKNVVILGWHPNKSDVIGLDFSEMKICHKSIYVNDIFTKFNFWISNNLAELKKREFESFIKQFNYPFDGKATERIINGIIVNE